MLLSRGNGNTIRQKRRYQSGSIVTTTAASFTACRFSFSLAAIHGARGQAARGAKTPFKRLFSFWGYSYISPTAKRAKKGEKSRENGNGTRNAQRNTAHGAKTSPYKPDKRHAHTNTLPTAQTPRKSPKKCNRGNAPRNATTGAGQERPRARAAKIADGVPKKSGGARRA